ncbi:MAG: diaminopimelate decarboxylase, partial [Muribaculaceae bacterium]|nr:diaminopimelate decarboxylase [Muribaculaceae bacterium]
HHYITTGLEENKFGIDLSLLDQAVDFAVDNPWLRLLGLHFHIGSQIEVYEPFDILCERIDSLVDSLAARGVELTDINVGGGLGIDYSDPDGHPVPDFGAYFGAFRRGLRSAAGRTVHCELGRSLTGQCGSLITRVVYVKKGVGKRFVIVDAGMTELIRPALYQASHLIQNISSCSDATEVYDVVGPVCESSDCFAESVELPVTRRGDFIAIRSAGAYGEAMASSYNCRGLAPCMAE